MPRLYSLGGCVSIFFFFTLKGFLDGKTRKDLITIELCL